MKYLNEKKLNPPNTENQRRNFSNHIPQKSNHNLKIIIWVLIIFLFASQPTTSKTAEPSVNYSVDVKENPTDATKTDVYLIDPKTNQETFYITLSDIFRNHYHDAEYHNGSLYIIHRTGGDSGYETNPNWTDELWKYDRQKKGVKLFSSRGLDFRVSEDEKMIAIVVNGDNDDPESNLTFIKTDGTVLKVLNLNQLGVEFITPIQWKASNFWAWDGFTSQVVNIIKIEAINFEATKFDVESLSMSVGEFDLNPTKEKIAFSNYPTEDNITDDKRSKMKINFQVYDLKTKKRQQIAISISKKFEPKWIDENRLEYNNPNGTGRLIKQIP